MGTTESTEPNGHSSSRRARAARQWFENREIRRVGQRPNVGASWSRSTYRVASSVFVVHLTVIGGEPGVLANQEHLSCLFNALTRLEATVPAGVYFVRVRRAGGSRARALIPCNGRRPTSLRASISCSSLRVTGRERGPSSRLSMRRAHNTCQCLWNGPSLSRVLNCFSPPRATAPLCPVGVNREGASRSSAGSIPLPIRLVRRGAATYQSLRTRNRSRGCCDHRPFSNSGRGPCTRAETSWI